MPKALESILIITGESSGELYGSLLAKTLMARHPGISIFGVGGERMKAAGVEMIAGISGSFGIIGVLKTIMTLKATFARIRTKLRERRPQVVVLIDFPDFNLRVARVARELGVAVQYYVSPQVWAWRPGRVPMIGRLIDQMAVLLPFEEEIYTNAGIPCRFIGHPALDEIRELVAAKGYRQEDIGSSGVKADFRRSLGLDPIRPVMVLMPGSRPHEVSRLLQSLSDVVGAMQRRHPDFQFVIPMAPNLDHCAITSHPVASTCTLVKGRSVETLLSADLAVIASGTSTLQAALLKVPHVVIYKVSKIEYFIGRRLVKVNFIALVNNLIERSLRDQEGPYVREFLQDDVTTGNIMDELTRIVDDGAYRDKHIGQLERVSGLFSGHRASDEVAGMVESLVK